MRCSIIITNYNNQKYLGRAIRSCLKQSEPAEVIVVDDASTDNSLEVINSFGDKIRSVLLPINRGVATASNEGILSATGDYVMRVDSDDYVNQDIVKIFADLLEWNKDLGFIYGDILRVDNQERVLDRINLDTLDMVLRHGAGIMFRKSYLEAIGLYDERLRNAEDYNLIKRYIKNWDGFHLPLPLYRYRQHDTNMTKDEEERKRWEKLSDENRK
jgi:glycosyltransferase involved in cell wall biosynthesis